MSLLSMLSAPAPSLDTSPALFAHAARLLAKLRRGAYRSRRKRRKALRRFYRAHHAAGRVMLACMGAEMRGER